MEHLIELWQQAKIDESRMDSRYQDGDLIPLIIGLEKRQQRLLRFKTLSVLILLPGILILFLNRSVISLNGILGIGIFISSVLFVVVLINRKRFQITDEERGLSTIQLTGVAEHKINAERKLFKTYLPLFVVVALTGFNLMNVDYFIDEELGTRVLYHLAMTGSLVVAFVIGLSIRIRRFQKQFLPVLERIKKFRDEAE